MRILKSKLLPEQAVFLDPRPERLPKKAYHLHFPHPVSWTFIRDVQDAIIKAYLPRYRPDGTRKRRTTVLPPTFLTFRFQPVFTFGRDPDERPTKDIKGLFEKIPWFAPDIRMAWHRAKGWRFFGPDQGQFWMVAEMGARNWDVNDVKLLMNSSLSSMLAYYLPPTTKSDAVALSESTRNLQSLLTHVEVRENLYSIVSHGCTLNVLKDPIHANPYGISRLLPKRSSLEEETWINRESFPLMAMRFVAEMTGRMKLKVEDVDMPMLQRRLRIDTPIENTSNDQERLNPSRTQLEATLQNGFPDSSSVPSFQLSEDSEAPKLVASWKTYVRAAYMDPQSSASWPLPNISTLPDRRQQSTAKVDLTTTGDPEVNRFIKALIDTRAVAAAQGVSNQKEATAKETTGENEEGIPLDKELLEETLRWTSASDFFFVPRSAAGYRRSIVSPLDLREDQYLETSAEEYEKAQLPDPVMGGRRSILESMTLQELVTSQKRVIQNKRIKPTLSATEV